MNKMVRSADKWGYVIVGSTFLFMVMETGLPKSFGVLMYEMTKRFNADKKTLGLICSLPGCLMSLLSPVVMVIMRLLPSRRSGAVIGGLLMGISVILISMATSVIHLATLLTITGIGMATVFLPLRVMLNEYFPTTCTFYTSLTFFGSTFGAIILPQITHYALSAYGFSGAFLILGGIFLHGLVCGATVRPLRENQRIHNGSINDDGTESGADETSLLIDEGRDDDDDDEHQEVFDHNETVEEDSGRNGSLNLRTAAPEQPKNDELLPWWQEYPRSYIHRAVLYVRKAFLFKNLAFSATCLYISFSLSYVYQAWMVFLIPSAEWMGITSSKAVYLATTAAIGGIIGKLVVLFLLHRGFDPGYIFSPINVVYAMSFTIMTLVPNFTYLIVNAFIQGFCGFAIDSVTIYIAKETVSDRDFDYATGISGFFAGVGYITGGFVSGWLIDVTASYTAMFLVMAALQYFQVFTLVIFLCYKRRVQSV